MTRQLLPAGRQLISRLVGNCQGYAWLGQTCQSTDRAWLNTSADSPHLDGLPLHVKVVEVGPRDGLQNEKSMVPTDVKVELVDRLSAAGLPVVEATSFVSPKWVPQLADGSEVFKRIRKQAGVRYPVLTPNVKGLERAKAAGVTEVAIFPAASEAFSRSNLNCSIAESLQRFGDVASAACEAGLAVRGYVSCAVACPYQGPVAPNAAAEVAGALAEMGCYEVSMGDTIGAGTPRTVTSMFQACLTALPAGTLASHMHDTHGTALANTLAALQLGIAAHDASVAGLGGCPYAAGATGNMATEDLVWFLSSMGIKTGVDLDALVDAGAFICAKLGRATNSRAAAAILAKRQREAAAA